MFSNIENEFEIFKKDYEENQFEVYIYGAGGGSYWTKKLLDKHNIPVKFIIDKNINAKEKHLDTPVISFEKMLELNKIINFKVLISSPKFESEIREELEQYLDNSRIYSFECELYDSFIPNMSEYKKYLDSNKEKFKEIYLSLADDFSRTTLKEVLMGRISGKWEHFKNVYAPNQYFCEDIIRLTEGEIMLDVGASYADTLEDILKRTNNKFKKIYCFELDKECIEKIEKVKKDTQLDNIEIINKGAWNKADTLTFTSNPTQGRSKIIDSNSESNQVFKVETIDIDSVIDNGVTFIKMDIEGAELKALEGAKEVIKKYKPRLAICVYHKIEDIIDIYDYITKLVPEYKVYLRHHNISGPETVLYAVI